MFGGNQNDQFIDRNIPTTETEDICSFTKCQFQFRNRLISFPAIVEDQWGTRSPRWSRWPSWGLRSEAAADEMLVHKTNTLIQSVGPCWHLRSAYLISLFKEGLFARYHELMLDRLSSRPSEGFNKRWFGSLVHLGLQNQIPPLS